MLSRRNVTALGVLLAFVVQGCTCTDNTGIGKADPAPQSKQSIDFGDVEVGASRTVKLAVSNTGAGLLKITDVAFKGASADWFQVSPHSATITQGGEKTFAVTFQPLDVGKATITIDFLTNSKKSPKWPVSLKGRGFLPTVQVSPTQLDFGNVVLETSKTMEVTVSNAGTEPAGIKLLDLTGQAASQFRLTPPQGTTNGTFLLQAGKSDTIQVTFTPTATDRQLAGFTVVPCDACQSVIVNLMGRGLESGLVVKPAQIAFGSVNPGATVAKPITFQNVGNQQVQITSVTAQSLIPGTPPDAAFTVTLPQLPIVLAEGDSVDVPVNFAPTDLKSHTGEIVWQSTDAKNPKGQVVLTGTGGGPDIQVTPATVDFGPVATGAPLDRQVLISNVGFDDLHLGNLAVTGASTFTLVTPPTQTTLKVGDVVSAVVEYAPTAAQSDTGTLSIASDDTDTPTVNVDLHGTGMVLPPCTASVQPANLNFGIVERNKKRTLQFGITNPTGSAGDCLVSNLGLTSDSPAEYTLPDGPVNGLILHPGDTKLVSVDFQPTRLGDFDGAVEFYVSDPNQPDVQVPLHGTSKQADILVAPDDLDFGVAKVGCSTRDRTFSIYNTGTVAVTLTDLQIVEPGPGGEFFLKSLPPGLGSGTGVTIGPGAQTTFTVAYRPKDLGTDSAAIYVTLAEFTNPFVITVTGTGATDAVQTDTFVQLDKPQADILFVVDNSCSMSDKQQQIATNFDNFIRFAQQQNIDYHIAVTTTDVTTGGGNVPGEFWPQDGSRPKIVTPDLADPEGTFRANVQVGINGDTVAESCMEGAYRALSEPLINDPNGNGGFLRPDAHLALILVTDEVDHSVNTTDFYLNFYLNVHGFRQQNLFSASTISGDLPSGCSGPGGSAEATPREHDLANRTGGISESICTTDWAKALENLSLVAFGYKTRFFLNNQPVSGTITVTVTRPDGTTYTATAWTFDASSNSIDFDPLAIPEPGDTITVTYEVACIP